MYFLKMLLLVMLCSCASNTVTDKYPNVDRELMKYVMRFDYHYYKIEQKFIANDIVVKLEVIKHSEKAGGVYHRILNTTTISLKHWSHWTESEREEVVFHELGHHVLRLKHAEKTFFKDGCPHSIMYYRGINPKCYKKRRRYYILELFKRGRDDSKRFDRLRLN